MTFGNSVRFLGAAVMILAVLSLPALAVPSDAVSSHDLVGSSHKVAVSSPVGAVSSSLARQGEGAGGSAPSVPRGGRLVSVLLFLAGLGLAGSVVITQVQPTNQIPTHDTFVADVTMASGDATATVPHGFGIAPLEVNILPTLQGTALPFSAITVAIDSTNIVLTKPTAANNAFNFRVVAKKPHTLGL